MTGFRISISTAGLMIALSLLLSSVSLAEPGKFEPKRTDWGSPDIQGTWDFRNLTPLERPKELADKKTLTPEEADAFRALVLKAADVDNWTEEATLDVEGAYNTFWWDWGTELHDDLRTSLIIDPPNGRLPDITPAAQARMEEQNLFRVPPVRDLFSYSADPTKFRPAGPESLGLSERCLVGFNAGPPLTPAAYNNNLRIIQTPGYTVLVTEMIHDARIIPMDNRPHLPPEIRRWSGDSRGRWQGNTLVVETTNFTDKTPTFQLPTMLATATESGAVGTGKDMHLIERFTQISESRLDYEYTITDPNTFVQPFTVSIPMRTSDGQMFEYACHEGNYSLPGILKGARRLDAEEMDAPAVLKVGQK
jgi:hypothetical protein